MRRVLETMKRARPALLMPVALTAMIAMALSGAACSKDKADQLRELRDEACACKTRECAAAVGGKLAKLAIDSDLDEARAKLAIEASTCLAAHGE